MIINVGNRIMNTYVYQTKSGLDMIDTGYEHSLKDVERKLNKNNIKLNELKYIFLTHVSTRLDLFWTIFLFAITLANQ